MVNTTDCQESGTDEQTVVSQTLSLDQVEVSQTLAEVSRDLEQHHEENQVTFNVISKPIADALESGELQGQVVVSQIQGAVSQDGQVQHAVVVSHPIDSVPVVCISGQQQQATQQISIAQNIEQGVQTIDAVCLTTEPTLACMNSVKQLDIGDAIRLLENVEQYPHITIPPVKPKAGEVYLFAPTLLEEQGK